MLLPSIRRCFAGLPKEIILADDRSHPEELRIASQQQGKGVRILLDQGNHGLENCLNLAMAHAQGDILIPVAADMEFVSKRFGRLIWQKFYRNKKLNIIFGKSSETDKSGLVTGISGWAKKPGYQSENENISNFISGNTRPTGCAVAFRREFLQGKQYESSLGPYSDFYLNNLALLEGDGWYVPKIVSRTLHRSNSYSKKQTKQNKIKHLSLLLKKPIFMSGVFSKTEIILFLKKEIYEIYSQSKSLKKNKITRNASDKHIYKNFKNLNLIKNILKIKANKLTPLKSILLNNETELRRKKIAVYYTSQIKTKRNNFTAKIKQDILVSKMCSAKLRNNSAIMELKSVKVCGLYSIETNYEVILFKPELFYSFKTATFWNRIQSFFLSKKELSGLSLLLMSCCSNQLENEEMIIRAQIRQLVSCGMALKDFDNILISDRSVVKNSLHNLGILTEKIRVLLPGFKYNCERLIIPVPDMRVLSSDKNFMIK